MLIPARTLSDTARSLGASGSIDVALGTAAGGDGLVGFEAGQRRTTTRLLDGEYPKVSSIFPTTSETESVIKTADLVEAVKRVALVAERNTPVRLRFSEGQVAIEAGAGDDAQASEAVEAVLTGPEIEIAFNPTYLLDGLGAVGTALQPDLVHPGLAPRGALGPGRGGRRGRHLLPLRADAGALRVLTHADLRRMPSGVTFADQHLIVDAPHTTRSSEMQLGLVGLGKMGGNMRERIRRAGHEVVGYDRNKAVSDARSLADLVKQLDAPRVVWVMVPSGAPTQRHRRQAGRPARQGRPGHRRRQQPVHRRLREREAAQGQGHRLPRLRGVRRHLGPRQRLRPDGAAAPRPT